MKKYVKEVNKSDSIDKAKLWKAVEDLKTDPRWSGVLNQLKNFHPWDGSIFKNIIVFRRDQIKPIYSIIFINID